jgi:uncharacterized repeat protein (TIGR04076 family)
MPDCKCKIAVIRKTFNKDLYNRFSDGHPGPCVWLEVGQEFVTESEWDPPEGLCTSTWADMRPIIHGMHAGNPRVKIESCTDGLRPVLFRLERVEA